MPINLADIPAEIATRRLLLRIPRVIDGPAVAAVVRASLAELKLWMPWATEAYGDADSEQWCRRSLAEFITGTKIGYSIIVRPADEIIGSVGAHLIDWKVGKCEIGYWLRSDRIGQGLMSEAVIGVAATLERLGMRRIEIRCDERNVRSAAVARRCGFDHEGTLRFDSLDPSGLPRSTMIFSRIATAAASQAARKAVESA